MLCRLVLGLSLLLFSSRLIGAAEERLNVLVIFTDDQRADTIAALGNPAIRTPSLDALVKRGVAFDRAFMQGGMHGATCVPSRAMLLSGRGLFRIDEKLLAHGTLPEAFGAAGYTTFATGKWHNGDASLERSFQKARAIFTGGMMNPMEARLRDKADGRLGKPAAVEGHACAAFAEETIRFLREHREGPFLAYLAFDGPHDPHIVPDDFPVRYAPDKVPLPTAYLPVHPFDNGEMTVRDEKLLPWPREPDAVRAFLAEYWRYVSYLDMLIGRVLAALEASPHAGRTLVVFAGDSGVARGSHGLIGKQNLYNHSVRVPLIIAGPGIPAGRRTSALCFLHDVLPTLGRRCGIAPPEGTEAIDLQPVLTDPERPGRPHLLFAYRDVQRAVTDGRWKLIRYPQIDRTQLFDLAADPDETKDLAAMPVHSGEIERLTALLKTAQQEAGDSLPLTAAAVRPAAFTPPPPDRAPRRR